MTFEDIENLFNYLAIHFENNPKVHSKRLKNAWLELLEPYDPADVKAALLGCLRDKRHFPDAPDVAAKCHIAATPATPASTRRAFISALQDAFTAKGLPWGPWEARELGMTESEYEQLVRDAGFKGFWEELQ